MLSIDGERFLTSCSYIKHEHARFSNQIGFIRCCMCKHNLGTYHDKKFVQCNADEKFESNKSYKLLLTEKNYALHNSINAIFPKPR